MQFSKWFTNVGKFGHLGGAISHMKLKGLNSSIFGYHVSKRTWKTWKIDHCYEKSGKTGIVRKISVIFIQVRENSEKTNCLVHRSFSLTHAWLFAKWLFHLLSVYVNSITLHSVTVSICRLSIY